MSIGNILQKARDLGLLRFSVILIDLFREKAITALSTSWFHFQCMVHSVSCGNDLEVYGKVMIRNPRGTISIGNRAQFISTSWRATAATLHGMVRLRTFTETASIRIADDVGLNGTSMTARSRTISIDSGTIIAPNVVIVDSDFHLPWPPETRAVNPGFQNDADVKIGKNVWVGMNTIILKGTAIGDNSVIGAGSVVLGVIPANVLAVGNPAKVVKRYA